MQMSAQGEREAEESKGSNFDSRLRRGVDLGYHLLSSRCNTSLHGLINLEFSIWISTLFAPHHTPTVGTTCDIGLLALALAMTGDERWRQRIGLGAA